MTDHLINLENSIFYVFWLKDPSGLPALELDLESNEYNVLVFTSYSAAKRYAVLKKPDLINHITELSVTSYGPKRIKLQAGLIKIARSCIKTGNATGFLFDHPGHTKAPCHYISVKDFLVSNRAAQAPKNTIFDFIKQAEESAT